MLKTLKLTNFGCHETLTVNFTEGLNVFRAANEAGKSTVLKGISYALWGARGMAATLADTVTWGKPLASLKVELLFSVLGKDYTIKRSNSGAELTSAELIVTGQTETANFISALLGANSQTAQATLFAAQKDIELALASDASGLIETLANLEVIPQLIEKVREKHPSGSIKHLEAQFDSLVDISVPQESRETLKEALDKADAALVKSVKALEVATAEHHALLQAATQAKSDLIAIEHNEKRRSQLLEGIENLVIPQQGEKPEIEALEKTFALAQKSASLYEAYTRFVKFDDSICGESLPDGTLTTLKEQRKALEISIKEISDIIHATDIEIATSSVEGICKVCGLEYAKVDPNSQVNAKKLQEAKAYKVYQLRLKDEIQTELTALTAKITSIEELQRIEDFNRRTLTNVVFDETFFPAKPVWQGDVPTAPTDLDTLWSTLSKARKSHAEFLKTQEDRIKKLAYKEALHKALDETPDLNQLNQKGVSSKKAAQLILEQEKIKSSEVLSQQTQVENCKQSRIQAQKAVNDYDAAVTLAETVNKRNAEQREKLTETIKNMEQVNGLLTKLKEARPLVTNKLWKMLTETVSLNFSNLRGTVTTVSRGETKGFLVDGKPVSVFSGSTRDILALSLRETLVKVFLPNVDFFVLDEPAAGCDENREAALIAGVAKAGFKQTLLITHSDIADSFAQNLITLD